MTHLQLNRYLNNGFLNKQGFEATNSYMTPQALGASLLNPESTKSKKDEKDVTSDYLIEELG